MLQFGRAIALGLLCTILVVGCARDPIPSPRAASYRDSPLRIATWNLEHLAEANGAGCRPRTDADYEALRSHADRLGADVIAFQEVENAAAAARVFPSDRWVVVISARPVSGRSGFCRGQSGPMIRTQDVGFAIRRGLSFHRNPDLRELGLSNPNLRWGVDITLRLPRPLRLLAVHLKSGCNINRDPNDPDCAVLFAQAPILERWADERARGGEDFAVIGDWNRRTAVLADEFLGIVSDDDPPAGRLTMADAGRRAACIARYPDFIDHIALSRSATHRIVAGSFAEHVYGGDERQYPSDHCPSSVALTSR